MLPTSSKLANLRVNPRTGLYIGPREPTTWIQATATAEVIDDPKQAEDAIARFLSYVPSASAVVGRVRAVPVLLRVEGLKLTDLSGEKPPVETWKREGGDA
jgi:hypothetical protein